MPKRQERSKLQKWLHDLETTAQIRGFKCEQWGSSDRFPLIGFTRNSPSGGPRIYLSAGIHGDEPAGPLAIEWLLQKDRLHRNATWRVCPLLNPVGWLRGTREGFCGEDHNRDYLNPKTVETAAHCAWIEKHFPNDLYLSLHEDWEATGFYLYEINNSGKPGFGREILKKVSRVMEIEPARLIDDHDVYAPGYIAHEPEPDEPFRWPEAIYHSKLYPHLSYTFETPSSLPLTQRVEALAVATEAAVEEFFHRLKSFQQSGDDDRHLRD